jgi:Uma2 family endonuclease
VGECWLVDPRHREIDVVELTLQPPRHTRYSGDIPVRSSVLPDWYASAADILS